MSRDRKLVRPVVAAVGLAGTIVSIWWFALRPRRRKQGAAGSNSAGSE